MDTNTIYESFAAFMQSVALPMHLAHPDHTRLDGTRTAGNWVGFASTTAYGRFIWILTMSLFS